MKSNFIHLRTLQQTISAALAVCGLAAVCALAACTSPSDPEDKTPAALPVINRQPAGKTFYAGQQPEPLTVDAAAGDGGTLSYQWFKGQPPAPDKPAATRGAWRASGTRRSESAMQECVPIDGATEASWLPPTDAIGTFFYYVDVTNTNPAAPGAKTVTVSSEAAQVVVQTLVHAAQPALTGPGADASYIVGQTAAKLAVSAQAGDGGTLSYQWYSKSAGAQTGSPLANETQAVFNPPTAQAGELWYYVTVTNTNTSVNGNQTAQTDSVQVKITTGAPKTITLTNTKKEEGGVYALGEPLHLTAKAVLANGTPVDVTGMINAKTLGGYDATKTGTQQAVLTLAGTASAPLAVEVKTLANRVAAGNGLILLYAHETWPALASGSNLGGGKDITLRAAGGSPQNAGYKITLAGTGKMFALENDAKLTLDSGVTLEGNAGNNDYLVGVTRGSLTVKTGAQITGNKGGGVYLMLGSLTMEGGRISGNTGASSGGGIAGSYAIITIKDGEISGNGANNGGGIYISGGSLTLKGGKVSGNTAQSSNAAGGGIYILSGSFTMEGGTVSGNTADGAGGGIYISSNCFFTMKGGKVDGNRANAAVDGGGGIYVGSNTNFNFEGGEIAANTAAGNGGGIFLAYSATFNKNSGGGLIYGAKGGGANTAGGGANTAGTGTGHALYLYQGGTAKYRDTTITKEQKLLASGGIFTLGDWRD